VPVLVPRSQRKRPANLTLAPETLRFGQSYAEANHMSLSGVVEALLGALEQTVATRAEPVTRNVADFGRVRGRIESLQVLSPEVAAAALRAAT